MVRRATLIRRQERKVVDNEYTYLENVQLSEKKRVVNKLTKQSKLNSVFEATLNVCSGFLFAWCLTFWILPLWGYSYAVIETLEITALYTAVSWLRSYIWRRIFERLR